MKLKKKNKIIAGLGIGLLSVTVLVAGILSSSAESNTKQESKVVEEKKEKPKEIPTNPKKNTKPSAEIKPVPKVKETEKQEKAPVTTEVSEKETPSLEKVEDVSPVVDVPELSQVPVEEPQPEPQENVRPTRNIASASAFATTQYSHTTATHSEGETYSILSSPVLISGNTMSGTITRTGVGAEKASIVLNYTLNFDSQGRYLSGSVTSSGYVTAQINLSVGEIYTGSVADVITTSSGYALSGSLLYPIRASFDFQF